MDVTQGRGQFVRSHLFHRHAVAMVLLIHAGGNLATALCVPVREGFCSCRAMKFIAPFITLCFGHKINGACNAAALPANKQWHAFYGIVAAMYDVVYDGDAVKLSYSNLHCL